MTAGAAYYPVCLDIRGRSCIVVGGGQVALRKTCALLECGARIKVIAPGLCPELAGMAADGKIAAQKRQFHAGDLEDAFLAIAATDSAEANAAVVREARRARVLVNVVDDPADSDFIVPASLRRGDLNIAVSTAGRSPALARKVRTRLEEMFPPEYGALAALVSSVRDEVRQTGNSIDRERWQVALDLDALLALVKAGDTHRARTLLRENLGRPGV